MSSIIIPVNTGDFAIIQTDRSKIFIWENRYTKINHTNATGATETLLAGTLMGRILTSQLVIPLVSTATDGSQFPVGILADDYTVINGATQEFAICFYGDIADTKVILGGSDSLDTAIAGRSIRDRIASDTVGIRLIPSIEMSGFDNQ